MTTTTPPPAVMRAARTDWLGPVYVGVVWAVLFVGWLLDIQTFTFFLLIMATDVLMTLLFVVWWFRRRTFSLGQRFTGLAATLLFGVAVGVLSHRAIDPGIYLFLFSVPTVLAVWAAWVIATRGKSPQLRTRGLVVCLALAWSGFLLIRINGLQGNMRANVTWRWTPTAEQMFLAQHPETGASGAKLATTQPIARQLELRPGDWPGFRGPRRDGIVRGVQIGLDWTKSPPTVLWRQRVGPAWSSVVVVDGCAFTQEQRGDQEAVVCRDAVTGREVWVHEDAARFDESMSGPGPRATPTFANGRIYAQGARGTLNCLDAATGRVIWSRDIGNDAGAAVPIWGFSNSPLVTGDRVIIFAGGEGHKGLLAYPLDGGNPIWTADAGKVSYSSPQMFDVGSDKRILLFANEGLFAIDPQTGHIAWQYAVPVAVGIPATLQPCEVEPGSIVLGCGAAFGAQRVRIGADGRAASREWVTTRMKPTFSDMVFHDGFLYGFDGSVFCCVDARTGQRTWRDGRYGAGQVILLEDQGVMIVSSEDGQIVLLRCNPKHNEELGRMAAISGKAWNHPSIAQGRLYVRSDAEMACLQLPAPTSQDVAAGM